MSDLISRIEAVLKEKSLTFNRAEHDLKFGNGTIKRWRQQSPRLNKLVLLAEYLDISLDYLVFGTIHSENSRNGESPPDLEAVKDEQGLTCDGSPLVEEEADLIAMYRLLPSHEREDLFDLLYFKYKKHVEKKAESIYWTYAADREESGPAEGRETPGGTA